MSARFHPLRVAQIVPETAEANSIRFEIPDELRDVFQFKAGQHLTLKADIGVVAVPRTAAHDVVDKLVAGGVKSVLNFAPTGILVRPGIIVRNVDLTSQLEVLSYYLRMK